MGAETSLLRDFSHETDVSATRLQIGQVDTAIFSHVQRPSCPFAPSFAEIDVADDGGLFIVRSRPGDVYAVASHRIAQALVRKQVREIIVEFYDDVPFVIRQFQAVQCPGLA